MDLGLELAGFEHVGAMEIDPLAIQTLRLNRPGWPVLEEGNVVVAGPRLIPGDFGLAVGELDLLAGGPPCQPFSKAAQWSGGRRGMEDERADTVHALLEMVSNFQPRAVLLENVLGFVQGRNSALPAIESHVERMSASGGASYRVHWRLVNAADYGVPQNRKRVMIVLARDDLPFEWPRTTHEGSPVTSWDAIGGLTNQHPLPAPRGKWARLLPTIPPGKNYQWLTSAGGGPELFGYRTKYWNFLLKLDPDLPSWTLSASPGPSTGPFHWENRPLTARECLRLQSFPDEWELPGDLRVQTKLAGNATPPLLAWAFGRSILSALGYADAANQFPRLQTALGVPDLPVLSITLPSDFVDSIGKKDPHPGSGLGPAASRVSKPSRA